MFPQRFTRCLLFAALTLMAHFLPPIPAQKPGGQRWLIGDRDSHCGIICSKNTGKPVCGSDGRSYDNNCDLLRAKCKDRTLTLAHRGRCKGKNWSDQSPVLTFPTSATEGKELEFRDSGQPKCHTERNAAQELAKKSPHESVFIPECNEDGTFAQVQCHTLTGYCWCVTTDGKPVSGSSVHNKTPVCSGNFGEFMGTHAGTSEQTGSSTDKPPGPSNSGKKDDGSKPTPTMETHVGQNADGNLPEHTAPTLRNWQVFPIDKQNNSSIRKPDKVQSCDRERQSALDDAQLNPLIPVFIPDCGPQGLYKSVQCHQSTGYCWCVLVDTGRPIRGTSARYKKPECDSAARSRGSDVEDPFRVRDLAGCPDGKKVEFITSLMDALTTDMVQAINSPSPPGGGRFTEPDPNHTLEERVVQWYFAQLDNNDSHDISKKEMKPFKRYVKKKAKPKRCARKFTEYCDLNKDKSITLQELKGCLGVSKEGTTASGGSSSSSSQGTRSPSMRTGVSKR